MSLEERTDRMEWARTIAREAGQRTLRLFQGQFEVEHKSDDSPVTAADRDAEQWMRRRIAERFPQDAILGEEFGETAGASGYRWILDPIDGTKSFVAGVPLYGTMVGVEHEQAAEVGVVYIPGLDEMVFAAIGKGAWYQKGTQAPSFTRVSTRSKMSEGVFVTTQVDTFDRRSEGRGAFDRLQQAAYITRTWGDCYGYLLVATGRAEVMVDPLMSVWDAAAIQPILAEAGGRFTAWNGESTIHGGDGVGTNGLVHDEVLRYLTGDESGKS